jgi:SHS2 domain-containing protein
MGGYREVEHTADWELEVWAEDVPGLLKQAAAGMYALAGVQIEAAPRIVRRMELQANDPEILLVGFLNQLLWLGESDQLAFDQFDIEVAEAEQDGLRLEADLQGGRIVALGKEIKAVTYHRLQIRSINTEQRVNIVFDV